MNTSHDVSTSGIFKIRGVLLRRAAGIQFDVFLVELCRLSQSNGSIKQI